MSLCFLPTAPHFNVVVSVVIGVVSTGVVIVTGVVVIVCLLIVVKHKHRKNSFGEDYTVAFATAFSLLFFHTSHY